MLSSSNAVPRTPSPNNNSYLPSSFSCMKYTLLFAVTSTTLVASTNVLKEVLEEHKFNYYFNPNNFGVIYVDFVSF